MPDPTTKVQDCDGVPPDDFPVLRRMETDCAVCGIIMLILWGVWVFFTARDLFGDGIFWTWNVGILALFGIAVLLAARIPEKPSAANYRRARRLLIACSLLCVSAIALFIYATGGAQSPFVSIYIMTFSLTIAAARSRRAWLDLGLFFGGILLLVFIFDKSRHQDHDPIPQAKLGQILKDSAYYWSFALGSLLSIVIACGSKRRSAAQSQRSQ
jgi:drug/metabolite transporter (DMT)-like permease